MKKLGKILSILMGVGMIITVIPTVSISARSESASAGITFEVKAEDNGVYKLVFKAKTPGELMILATVFSFDSNIIQPVFSENPTVDFIVSNHGAVAATSTLAFKSLLRTPDAIEETIKGELFSFAPTLWAEIGNRTGFYATVFHPTGTKAIINGVYQDIFAFYFKFQSGKSIDDVIADTFKFESGSDPNGFVLGFFPPGNSSGVFLQGSDASETYHWGHPNQAKYSDKDFGEVINPYVSIITPSPLTGKAVIDNMSPKVGGTLTGSLVEGNNTGVLTYKWISGVNTLGTGSSYTVQAGDLGNIIILEITSNVETGALKSDPTAIVSSDNGEVKDDDCEVKDDDGEVKDDDGKVKDDDGEIKDDDGEVKDDDGKVKDDDGEIKDDDSEVKDDDGEVKDDDGKVKDDDGEVKDDDGEIKDDDGEVKDDETTVGGHIGSVMAKTNRSTVLPGELLIFTITVENDASATATWKHVVLTDVLPSMLEYLFYRATPGIVMSESNGTITIDCGDILIGGAAIIDIYVRVSLSAPAGTVFLDTVVVRSYNDSNNPADDPAPPSVIVIGNFDVTTQPDDIIVYADRISGNLSFEVEGNVNKSNYIWFQQLGEFPEVGRDIIVGTGTSFSIPVTLSTGAHYYYCIVSTPLGLRVSRTAEVTVNPPSDALVFTDENGKTLSNLISRTCIATLSYQNKSEKAETLSFMAVIYNKSGTLIYKSSDTKEIEKGQLSDFKVRFDMPENEDGSFALDGYYVNVFLWDSVTMAPVCEKRVFPSI